MHPQTYLRIEPISDGIEFNTDFKNKPYKPRFHTTKSFYDSMSTDNQNTIEMTETRGLHSDLSIHINDVINKNNAIINSHDPLRKPERNFDKTVIDEPLNLTNKPRKRCLSEVTEPVIHTSLIKELLLKNLYADTNMQCPHCKMIFQTVTELELHKMRSCKACNKTGARYSRSSSVNVSI